MDRLERDTTRQRWLTATILTLIVAAGLFLRVQGIDTRRLAGDEIESTLNALTILEHGVPVDHYLDQPIYENALTKPWPESAEYEFKDTSYSERGYAVYHSWIPLYSIAAALHLAGVRPDVVTDRPHFRDSVEELTVRTVAPRVPSMIFSALFIVFCFFAGRRMGGDAMGWTAAVLAALTSGLVALGFDARYRSATLAFTAACAVTGLRLVDRPRLRDFALHGLALGVLFHTHVLSCFVACAMSGALFLTRLRRPGTVVGVVACVAVLATLSVPWILATGYLDAIRGFPKAWEFMDLPGDALLYAQQGMDTTAIFVAALGALAVGLLFRDRIPSRLSTAIADVHGLLWFVALWATMAFLAFTFLMPLASYWAERMSMMLAVPKVLFMAIVVTVIARVVSRDHARWLAPALGVLALIGTGRIELAIDETEKGAPEFFADFARDLNAQGFAPGTRFYASPGMHFAGCYFYGVPVQSIAPIRKSWLDGCPGEIALLDFLPVDFRWNASKVMELAERAGQPMSEPEADDLAAWARSDRARRDLAADVGSLVPAGGTGYPGFVRDEIARLDPTWETKCTWLTADLCLIFKGFEVNSDADAWMTFYYRFVDPLARRAAPNFRERMRSAHVTVTRDGLAIYRSPPSR